MFSALLLSFPNIDPVIFQIGPIALRWYSLAYMLGVVGGWWYLGVLDRRTTPFFTTEQRDDVILWAIAGIILGGRLGYVLFYNFGYFVQNPSEILQVWQGGMSFHGGTIGVTFAFWLYARKNAMRWVPLMDRIACVTPIGLFFGRISNFINGELYGRTTDAYFGMVFPNGGTLPRHPSQLYEAALEGLAVGLILWFIATKRNALGFAGRCSGIFLCGYSVSRFFIEYFREPDAHLGFILGHLSMGQLLCIPMVLLGIWLIMTSSKRPVEAREVAND